MPWSQTSPMDQKTQFIADHLRQVLSISRTTLMARPFHLKLDNGLVISARRFVMAGVHR